MILGPTLWLYFGDAPRGCVVVVVVVVVVVAGDSGSI